MQLKIVTNNATLRFNQTGQAITEITEPFVLVEVYRTSDAAVKHKETGHYAKWRDTVATMMAEPRSSVKYTDQFWTA